MNLKKMLILRAGVLTLALTSSMLCQAPPAPATVIGKFVGNWKENEAKRKVGGAGPGLRFRYAASGQLEELRGPDEKPLVEEVTFDGKPHPVDDGRGTIEWKQIDANHFEREIFADGKLVTTRRIEVSTDGKALTEVIEQKSADGKPLVSTGVFKRSSGDAQGLVGTWVIDSRRTSQPAEQKIEAQGSTGLRVTNNLGVTQTYPLDGKPTPAVGPSVISGTMVAARVIDPNSIEITNSREGVVFGKATWVLSNNGKTLTYTSTANNGRTGIRVFEKQ